MATTVSRKSILPNVASAVFRKCKPVFKKQDSKLIKNAKEIKDENHVMNKTYRIKKSHRTPLKDLIIVESETQVAASKPCVTCGRSELPERFHSHPPTSKKVANVSKKLMTNKTDDKKTIQNPFKFKKYKENDEKLETKKEMVVKENIKLPKDDDAYKIEYWSPAPNSGGRNRTSSCYLCCKQIPTSNLPFHEATCIQAILIDEKDVEQTRDIKTNDENDDNAWKVALQITQANATPCKHCRRKFIPTRLQVHEKVCRSKMNDDAQSLIPGPPGVKCEICGKKYGSKSIQIHKEQCLRKTMETSINEKISANKNASNVIRKKPHTVFCYLCGREFGSKSITFHEPQCLKKWKMENDRLPQHLKRDVPKKPDIVYDPETGKPDLKATQESTWKAHLEQLVACTKCNRTFYPDRLAVHLISCKGPTTKIKIKRT